MLINNFKLIILSCIISVGLMHDTYGSNNQNIDISSVRSQELIKEIKNSNDGINIDINNVTNQEGTLFGYYIKQSPVALYNASRILRSILCHKKISNNFIDKMTIIKRLSTLIDFHGGLFHNDKLNLCENNVIELVVMIANYYITQAISGQLNIINMVCYANNIVQLQNFLLSYGYNMYYCNYFAPRYQFQYEKQNTQEYELFNPRNNFLFNTITLSDWNQAVNIVQELDLPNTIKRIVKGINIANQYFYLIGTEQQQTNQKKIDPIILQNGTTKCWLNSTWQLICAAINLLNEKQKREIDKPEKGYVCYEFIKYLQQKSKKFILQDSKYLDTTNNNYEYLNLIEQILNFDKVLIDQGKSQYANAWNNLPGVLSAKSKLESIKGEIKSNSICHAYYIITQIFPELKLNNIIYCDTIYIDEDCTMWNAQIDIESSANSKNDYATDTLPENIIIMAPNNTPGVSKYQKYDLYSNKWLTSFNNGKLVLYELIGVQLQEGNHVTAFAKASNNSNDWYYSNSAGKYSLQSDNLNSIFTDDNIKNDYRCITAYVFRKVSNQEFLQNIPEYIHIV